MLIRVTDGGTEYPFNIKRLHRENKDTSFPRRMTPDMLAEHQIYHVYSVYPPEIIVVEMDPILNIEVTKHVIPEGQKLVASAPTLLADKWTITYTLVNHSAEAIQNKLDRSKKAKQDAIRASFNRQQELPVNFNGVDWSGGFDSAIKLDAAKRLAQEALLDTVTFFDINNVGYVLSIADASNVVMAVASTYQTTLAKKQGFMVASSGAADVAELKTINIKW